MHPDLLCAVKQLVLDTQDYKEFPYADNGTIKIGLGRDIQNRGISLSEALYLTVADLNYYNDKLSAYVKFYDSLSDPRKCVLIFLAYQNGLQNLFKMNEFMMALESSDYERAANELQGVKFDHLAIIMREGTLP